MRAVAKGIAATLLGVALGATGAAAQQVNEPSQWAKKFFDGLMNQGPDRAAALVNEETALGQRVKTVAPVLRDSAAKAIQSYGTIIDYELAREAKLGARSLRQTYVVNHRNGATLYRLYFYRGERGWDLFGLQMEAEIIKFDFD